MPATAVAFRSSAANRSSRPSPRRPRIVSLLPPRRKIRPAPTMIANISAPARGSPPTHCAAQSTIPMVSANPGTYHLLAHHLCLAICIEDLLHRSLEVPGERDRERQRRRVALLLDRVDRLPGDACRLCQVLLGETQ